MKGLFFIFALILAIPLNGFSGHYLNAYNFGVVPSYIKAGAFSENEPGKEMPTGWESLTFRGIDETRYSLVDYNGTTVVKAESNKASSGLIRRQEIDLAEYPILRWSWKTEQVFELGDVTSKDGDDYPVRIYIIFDYDSRNLSLWQRIKIRAAKAFYGEVPSRAITYIWDTNAYEGMVVPNPYTNLVKMIVIESGESRVGRWLSYEVNVLEDYRDIYGEEPPAIAAVAIMTDTDDTGSKAVSYYGDIRFYGE